MVLHKFNYALTGFNQPHMSVYMPNLKCSLCKYDDLLKSVSRANPKFNQAIHEYVTNHDLYV